MMDRRGFLKILGMGGAAAIASEAIPLGRVWSFPSKIVRPTGYATYIFGRNALLAEYADYVNFSDLVLTTAVDPIVEAASTELAVRYAAKFRKMYPKAAIA